MTFYVFNLAVACYVIPDVIVTALFVNMLFSAEDMIVGLIKNYIS